jgi:hypothetical protein
VEIPTTGNVWRRWGWHCKIAWAWLNWGNQMHRIVAVGPLPTRSSSLPWQEHSTALFQCWRYGSSMNPGWYRASQA